MSVDQKEKVRVPNFTGSEKAHLIRIIANKNATILEDKKTDRASSAHQEKAWQAIETEFNASSNSNTHRNAACLKKCYENRKKELRKSLADERKEIMLTGGGPPPKIKKDENDDILISILNKKTLVGLTNPFDDDADESAIAFQQGDFNNMVVEYIVDTDEERDNGSFSQTLQSTRSFTNAKHSEKILEDPNNLEYSSEVNLELDDYSRWKKYTPKQQQTPVSAPLVFPEGESGKHVCCAENKTPKRSLSRRRPATVIKPLTSSDIAKKYNLLLDKRLQLIDSQLTHNARENELAIKKHQLEIEILQIELTRKRKNNTIVEN